MAEVNRNLSRAQRNQIMTVETQSQLEQKSRTDPRNIYTIGGNSKSELVKKEDDEIESDIISAFIGEIGKWQLFWVVILCLFQFPITFHIFCLVFQVSTLILKIIKKLPNFIKIKEL